MRGPAASRQNLNRPVVILGAARSGTKALRTALALHPRLAAVPHDINYVWKYGHYGLPHDELSATELDAKTARFIRRKLGRWQGNGAGVHLLEKTVSNTLRVDYVRAVLPQCRFLHLIRDGRDVAASSRRMWRAPADWSRLWGKLRTFPIAALPRYGAAYLRSYLRSYLRRSASGGGRVSSWGPRFAGIDEAAARLPLLSVCGLQWRRCVEAAQEALARVPTEDRWEVRYEELVRDPQGQLAEIFRFLDLEAPAEILTQARNTLSATHTGKWRRQIEPDELDGLLNTIGPTLDRLGYSPSSETSQWTQK